jgi:hypothetical protein
VATTPLVRLATDCIVRAVVADPRYGKQPAPDLGDLIVDSVPACRTPVHAIIAGTIAITATAAARRSSWALISMCCRARSRPRRRTRRHSAATRHQVRLGPPRPVPCAGRVSRLHRGLTRRATARSRRLRACWSGRRARPDPPPG